MTSIVFLSRSDSLSKLTISALREIPIRHPDPSVPAAEGDEGEGRPPPMQTVLYGYIIPTADGGKTYAYAREAVFQEVLLALLTAINVDLASDGQAALVGVADIPFPAFGTSISDFRLGVYSLLSYSTVGTGEQLIASAKTDVESLHKVCRQDKARERKIAEKGIDNESYFPRLSSSARRPPMLCQPVRLPTGKPVGISSRIARKSCFR